MKIIKTVLSLLASGGMRIYGVGDVNAGAFLVRE